MVEVMVNVTINAGGTIPTGTIYCQDDVDVLKQRLLQGPGGFSSREIPVDYDYNRDGTDDHTAGIVGVDSSGQLIAQSSDLIVLPCPPYCNGDYCNGINNMTASDVIAYLSA